MSVVIENDGTKKVWKMSSVHWYLVSILIKRVLFVSVHHQTMFLCGSHGSQPLHAFTRFDPH